MFVPVLNTIIMPDTSYNDFLQESINELKKYKGFAEKAIAQLHTDDEMHWQPGEESNSVAVIMKHLHGNMLSRWTDFLTTDGEKPTRTRDEEFIGRKETKEELMKLWEEGWKCMFGALESLNEDDFAKTITIRNEPHTIIQAILRQMTHYAQHVGQIIYIAKMIRNEDWNTLSIPRKK